MQLRALLIAALLASQGWFVVPLANQQQAAAKEVARKQTRTGLEIALIGVVTERDAYRFGACPSGDSGIPDRVVVLPGMITFVAHFSFRILPAFKGQNISKPILLDRDGKEYRSEHSYLPAQKLVADLKGTQTALDCEFPFQVPAGTRPASLQLEGVSFEVPQAGLKAKAK